MGEVGALLEGLMLNSFLIIIEDILQSYHITNSHEFKVTAQRLMISELSLRFEEVWIIMNTFLYHICFLHQKEEWKIPGSDISGTKERET